MTILSEKKVIKNEITLRPLSQTLPAFIRNPRVYDVDIIINNDQLYHILHDLSALSRQVEIAIENQAIALRAKDESGTTSNYSQKFNDIDPEFTFSHTYLLKFIEKFTKPGINKFAHMRIGRDLPFNIVYYWETSSLEMSIAALE